MAQQHGAKTTLPAPTKELPRATPESKRPVTADPIITGGNQDKEEHLQLDTSGARNRNEHGSQDGSKSTGKKPIGDDDDASKYDESMRNLTDEEKELMGPDAVGWWERNRRDRFLYVMQKRIGGKGISSLQGKARQFWVGRGFDLSIRDRICTVPYGLSSPERSANRTAGEDVNMLDY